MKEYCGLVMLIWN